MMLALTLPLFLLYNAARAQELVNPCIDSSTPQSKQPWCDARLSIDDRVNDMISRMSVAEKISCLDTGGGTPVASLGIPGYNWWSESSTGVSSGSNHTTKFPFPITTGMSFNRTLWNLVGRQIGREARALMNDGFGYSTFWAPVINLAREPRWGRNIETPGEDPYLSGEYAEWFVKGMEQAPEDPYHIQASACCKHYVANSMESTDQDGIHEDRNHYNADIPMQDLVDSYMAPFQACVEKGKVSGLMCSYNAVNGVPSCANDWLLTTVARGEWGFDGYITSDCDADNDVVVSHHYHNDSYEEGVRDVLRAGTDVDCGSMVGNHAQSALDKGLITEQDIDERLQKLFRVRMRLSHFDPVGPLQAIPADAVCSDYAQDLAQDGAAQGSTLLKNTANTLPLSADKAGTVAVIGPNSKLSRGDTSYYGPRNPCADKYWTMVDAVSQHATKVTHALGVPDVLSTNTSGIPAAVALAKAADTVILVLGTDLSEAREGHDAESIAVSVGQAQLAQQVAAAASKPVVVVTLTATPLDISAILADDKVGAVLHAGQPSVNTLGIGDVLFGAKVPAGRTIQTIYPESYQDQISIFDFNMRPGPSKWPRPDCQNPNVTQCPMGTNPGRTHRFYTGQAVVPFGFGLSYSTFEYKVHSAPVRPVSLAPVHEMLAVTQRANRTFPAKDLREPESPLVEYTVNVTNTGSIDADDVVLGFITPPGAGQNGVPLQTLWGFQRVHVKAGETVQVSLYPALTDFTMVDTEGKHYVVDGEHTISFGIPDVLPHGGGFVQHKLMTVSASSTQQSLQPTI